MSTVKQILKNALALALLLLGLALVGLLVGCPIKRFSGLPCPGCGLTRACLSLLAGDLRAALAWHPLCLIVPPLCVMFVLKNTSAGRRFWSSAPLMALLAAALVFVYIWRMAVMFPATAPMDFDKNALIVKIVHKILLH